MEIVDKSTNTTNFGSLEDGDIFKYQQEIYMVIPCVDLDGEVNAICLNDTRYIGISFDERVVKVKAKLIIE